MFFPLMSGKVYPFARLSVQGIRCPEPLTTAYTEARALFPALDKKGGLSPAVLFVMTKLGPGSAAHHFVLRLGPDKARCLAALAATQPRLLLSHLIRMER